MLRRLEALLPDRPLLLALSGGGDSMALLHLLVALGKPVMAAHLDHGLRPESRQEAGLLEQWCARLKVRLAVRRAPVAEKARQWGVLSLIHI